MIQHRRTIFVMVLVIVVSGFGHALLGQESSTAAGGTETIQMSAKKYEFNPAEIKVKQGQHVKLVITATDRDHGFKLDAYNIDQRLKKGVATPVEFTADKAGTFQFECSVVCGLGHRRMKGQLVVEPSAGGVSP